MQASAHIAAAPVSAPAYIKTWPLWQKILFRFFFIFLFFQAANWLSIIPYSNYVLQFYDNAIDWLVHFFNAHLFHVKDVLVPENGSGDTSRGWANLWTVLTLSAAGSIVWSIIDRKRPNYTHLNYWLCLCTRYYVALIAFTYGIDKVLPLQMPFPNMHQLATPLGDFLPMRLSWMFIGYSTPYEIFSGIMEVFAGLLLLYRRTASLGAFVAAGVFLNVMMLNLSYDIPVKIFSMQMVFICLFLLANEGQRLFNFFVLNRPAALCTLYFFTYPKKWMRITRIVLKLAFIALAIIMPFYNNYQFYQQTLHTGDKKQPVANGVYEVAVYNVNGHAMPLAITDTIRWQDVIFENGLGSAKTADTAFRQRYKRGYFAYEEDSTTHQLNFKNPLTQNLIASFKYDASTPGGIKLWGLRHTDSLYIELKKTNRHFQLAERQFHWLSEANR